jgi:hypothetical protein
MKKMDHSGVSDWSILERTDHAGATFLRGKFAVRKFSLIKSTAAWIGSIKVRDKYSTMREIHKMCRICLQTSGSRSIFETSTNLLANCSDLARIAEKLRFVTMLKVRMLCASHHRSRQSQYKRSFGRENATLVAFSVISSESSLFSGK